MTTMKESSTAAARGAAVDGTRLGEAFGAADEGFLRAVDHALEGIGMQTDEPAAPASWWRHPARFVIAAVLICGLLAASLAVANEYRRGVLDFFSGSNTAKTDEAAELVVTASGNETAQTDWARFEVTDYLYDGRQLLVTVNVTATSDDILLLTPGFGGANRPVQDMTNLKPYYASEQQSIADYVATHELRAYRVEFDSGPPVERFDGSMSGGGERTVWEDAGRLTIMVSMPIEPDQTEIALRFDMFPVDLEATEPYALVEREPGAPPKGGENGIMMEDGTEYTILGDLVDDHTAGQTVILTLNIDAALLAETTSTEDTTTILGLAEPVVFEEYGITIDGVRLTVSPLKTYLMIYGTVHDESRLMPDTSPPPPGAPEDYVRPPRAASPWPTISLGSGEEPRSAGCGLDGNGGYLVEAELSALSELPRDMTLTLSYDEDRYSADIYPQAASWPPETHTLALVKTE
jgi:hypothetical protein